MRKVLLITFEYPTGKNYCGGVGQIVKQCRQTLLELGLDVSVLISSEFLKKHSVQLLRSDGSLVNYANFRSFEKENDLFRYNTIIQHFVNWTGVLEKIKKSRGKRPRIIYHFHSILRRERDEGFKTLNHFLFKQEKMIALSDEIICPSRYEYDNFSRYFPSFLNKVVLIENTVETFPANMNRIKHLSEKHAIKDSDIVSIYVGRFERIKGAETIIRHIPRVLKKHKNLKFFMVGKTLEPDLYKKLLRLKKKYPKRLFHIRYVDKSELFQYYYLSDIYVNTSLSESFSLSTHESAFCNTALLLNKLPVLEKFRGAALFLEDDKDGSDFTAHFDALINNPSLRQGLSRKARRIAKDFVGRNRLSEHFSKLLNS